MANAPAYQPRWTKGQPGGSDVLDRNLREIATALAAAFGTIEDLRTTIVNITGGSTTNITNLAGAQLPPGLFDGGGDGEGSGDMGPPGRDGRQGVDGRAGSAGADGEDGDMSFTPGPAGPPGLSVKGPPGPQGDDGDDAGSPGSMMDFSGMPRGSLPGELDTTGDVLRLLQGDSRIRGADASYVYSRVVCGPYIINDPAVLSIEDNAVLAVI